MHRRQALKALGASITSLAAVPATATANDGHQPIQGELPNENAPYEPVFAFGPGGTREVGQFLRLQNGWVFDDREQAITLFESTRQTFHYDGQTFVLEGADDWLEYEDPDRDRAYFLFTHTDPPKTAGKTFQTKWELVFTDDYYDDRRDIQFEPGESYSFFPFGSTYEIVGKDEG